jgi:hypothetical protein
MALSRFRSFDSFGEELPIKKSCDLEERKDPIKNDEDLEKELEKLRKARIITDDSMKARITF